MPKVDQTVIPSNLTQTASNPAGASTASLLLRLRGAILFFGFILLLSSIGVGGFFLGVNFRSNNLPVQTQPDGLTPTPTPDPMDGWKQFQTKQYQFKIPPDWHESQDDSGESGILLVSNNLDYVDFGNFKSGALIYVPVGEVSEALMDAILSENIKRGYRLLSDKSVALGSEEARQITIESPLAAVEIQLRFKTSDGFVTFMNLVTSKDEADLRMTQLELMASSFELLTPRQTTHVAHPKGLFELDYPSALTLSTSSSPALYRQLKETWEFASPEATVTLVVEPFQRFSLADEVKNRYQKNVLSKNLVGEPLRKTALAGRTAYTYTEIVSQDKRQVFYYFPMTNRQFLLSIQHPDQEQARQAAQVMFSSLEIH